jgi:hypothetical protein
MRGAGLLLLLLIGFGSGALRTCHGHMKFTPLENESHGIQFLYEKKPEIYTWLLQQHK